LLVCTYIYTISTTDRHDARTRPLYNVRSFVNSICIYTNLDWRNRKKRTHASSCYTNTNQPNMKPDTESTAGAIGARSSASVPDLKPGLPLELGRLPEEVDEPVPDVGLDVALGMSDDGTAEMGEGD
jgi:hypothetical protein